MYRRRLGNSGRYEDTPLLVGKLFSYPSRPISYSNCLKLQTLCIVLNRQTCPIEAMNYSSKDKRSKHLIHSSVNLIIQIIAPLSSLED